MVKRERKKRRCRNKKRKNSRNIGMEAKERRKLSRDEKCGEKTEEKRLSKDIEEGVSKGAEGRGVMQRKKKEETQKVW